MTPLEILEPQLRPVLLSDASASGVYFLVESDEIVYVGSSRDVSSRVESHRYASPFDRALWVPLPVRVLPYYEGAFIRALNPCGNSAAPVDCGYDEEILYGFEIGHLGNSQSRDLPSLSRGIRMARARAGMSAHSLARALGVSRQAVYWWESGEATPTVQNLQRIASALSADVGELLSGDLVQ